MQDREIQLVTADEIEEIKKRGTPVSPHVCRSYLEKCDEYGAAKKKEGRIFYAPPKEHAVRLQEQKKRIKQGFDTGRSKVFFNLESGGFGSVITKEQLKQAVLLLMSSIFEKRKAPKEEGKERLERQTIVVQACNLQGHTIGFAVNTDGEIVIFNGLGSYNDNLDPIIEGFHQACKKNGIEPKTPQIYVPPFGHEKIKSKHTGNPSTDYQQVVGSNSCVLIAAKMLASVDPQKPLSQQVEVFDKEMKEACADEALLRKEIYDGVNAPATNIAQRRDQPAKPKNEPASIPSPPPIPKPSTGLASPPLSIEPKHVSPRIGNLRDIAKRMKDPTAISDAEKVTGTTCVLFNAQCIVDYNEQEKTVRMYVSVHKDADRNDVNEQREVFSMSESRITTAPNPQAADVYLALKEASAAWPGQKLVIECSPKDVVACRLAMTAHCQRINEELQRENKPKKELNDLFELKEKIEKTPKKAADQEKIPEPRVPRPNRMN